MNDQQHAGVKAACFVKFYYLYLCHCCIREPQLASTTNFLSLRTRAYRFVKEFLSFQTCSALSLVYKIIPNVTVGKTGRLRKFLSKDMIPRST